MGPDYSNGKHFFPDITGAYRSLQIAQPMLTNSPRIDQLIQGDKLMLSLEDVISLALENNLNISVQKFQPWIEETQLLKAKSGGIPQSGATQQVVLGTSPSVSFDPIITGTVGWQRSTIPVNNPFISGTGTTSDTAEAISSNGYTYNFGYSEGFHTGTNFSVTLNTTRQASNLAENLFNPFIQPVLTATLTQPLLNGFGILVNTRYILEAKNFIKVSESQLAQQVIATVTQVSNDYWELVFDRQNVIVQEAAVGVSTKLYEDNKKQLQIGTMAPLLSLIHISRRHHLANALVAELDHLFDEPRFVLLDDSLFRCSVNKIFDGLLLGRRGALLLFRNCLLYTSHLLFELQQRRQNSYDFLADSVAVFDEINFRCRYKKIDDSMRDANGFLTGQSHVSGELISFHGRAGPSLS